MTFRAIPSLSHVYFTGDRDAFDVFMYHIKDAINEMVFSNSSETGFTPDKRLINWIARHFRYPKEEGSMEDTPSSFKWWIGLLEKNARALTKPISHVVSVEDEYVLPELATVDAFLAHLQETFGGRQAVREYWRKALYALKQGDRDIQQFNIEFNSLVYGVDLTETERCDIYEEGLDVGLLTIAIKHTDWRQAKSLKDKQGLAATAAYIADKLAELNVEKSTTEDWVDQQAAALELAKRPAEPNQPK